MPFEKLLAFTKDVSDLPDKPTLTPAELKAQFDAAPDEVRTYLNKLIDALIKTTAGDSGAKNIATTTISGLTGNDVQTILEALKTSVDSKVAKAGDTLTGSLKFSVVGDTMVSKQAGRKSLVIHRPSGSDNLIIAPSTSVDAEDWDWAKQYIFQSSGVFSASGGYSNVGRLPAFTWSGTITNGSFVNINHNLGYKPIVQFDGNTGNLQLNVSHATNSTTVSCFSDGGNNWTGTISFY